MSMQHPLILPPFLISWFLYYKVTVFPFVIDTYLGGGTLKLCSFLLRFPPTNFGMHLAWNIYYCGSYLMVIFVCPLFLLHLLIIHIILKEWPVLINFSFWLTCFYVASNIHFILMIYSWLMWWNFSSSEWISDITSQTSEEPTFFLYGKPLGLRELESGRWGFICSCICFFPLLKK